MKVLVTGSAGLPGNEIVRRLEERGVQCLGVDAPELDLADAESVFALVQNYAPDVIVHCSSPQVFPGTGNQPFAVSDAYGPKNVFGMSKVQGEDAVRSLLTRYYIVRADWIYGTGKRDFLRPLLKAAHEKKSLLVSSDQVGSPTYAKDLARLICDLIATDRYGIWHARNEGYYSRAEFASLIMKKNRQCLQDYSHSHRRSSRFPPPSAESADDRGTASGIRAYAHRGGRAGPLPHGHESVKLIPLLFRPFRKSPGRGA